jgi:predicted Zn-ribbon and HTH transcriptional regulator
MAARKVMKGFPPRRRGRVTPRLPDIEKLMDLVRKTDPDDIHDILTATDSLSDGDFSDDSEIESLLDDVHRGLDSICTELEIRLAETKKLRAEFNKNQVRIENHYAEGLAECPHCGHKFNKDSM